MSQPMSKPVASPATKVEGTFIWYDLMTTDPQLAATFYSEVIGWNAKTSEVVSTYTILFKGEDRIGGLMALPEDYKNGGGKPCWNGYIAVDDVDGYITRIKKAGGSVCKEPWDIP